VVRVCRGAIGDAGLPLAALCLCGRAVAAGCADRPLAQANWCTRPRQVASPVGGLDGQRPEPGLFARFTAVLWRGIGVWCPIGNPRHPADSHRHEHLERCLFGLDGDSLDAGILVAREPALLLVDCVGIGSFCPVCRPLEHGGLEILMKAIVCTKYGPPEVLELKEVDKPIPKNNEVLIRIYATTVHRGDTRMRSLNIPGPRWQLLLARIILGIRKPKRAILGMELAGEIVEVGKDVTLFKKGDKVFASTMWSGFGGYAEYKCMAEDGVLAIKPANMTFEEAAVIPSGGITTLGIVKMANIQNKLGGV
jgi:hypothetical protein